MKTGKLFRTCAVSAAVAGLTAWTSINTQAAVTYRKIALTGDAAPGTGPGVSFESFFFPSINAAGQTVFRGFLAGPGVDSTNDGGIWSEGSGSLGLVARTGDAAPGTDPGVVYSNLSRYPVLNGIGQTAFFSDLTGPDVDVTNDVGIWSEGSGSLSLVARTGDAAPGTGPGVVYDRFVNESGLAVLNGAGQTAFMGFLTGPGVASEYDVGLWSEGLGSLGLVARTGDAAPGTGLGVVYSGLQSAPAPVLNGAGQTTFMSFLIGSGVDTTNREGIWSGGTGSLNLVARAGDPAPGTGAGEVYRRFRNLVLNGAGQVAFQGDLASTGNKEGLWSEGSGTLSLVALEGDPAPGTGTGVVFRDFNSVFSPLLNGAGQTAFRGELTGTGVDATNNWGIWATDSNGLLTLIARQGDLFDVNDDPLIDDLRTISRINLLVSTFDNSENGLPTSFNDAGQLAFRLVFTDGSWGIFVATIGLGGDLNGDGFVGIADLNAVIGNWNQNVTPGDPLMGDANGDGFVGIEDLNAVLGNWNTGIPPDAGAEIPEPGSGAVVLVGIVVVLRRGSGRAEARLAGGRMRSVVSSGPGHVLDACDLIRSPREGEEQVA